MGLIVLNMWNMRRLGQQFTMDMFVEEIPRGDILINRQQGASLSRHVYTKYLKKFHIEIKRILQTTFVVFSCRAHELVIFEGVVTTWFSN